MANMWNQIRKFSLEYCDLPTMISNVSVLLRVLTLNIDSKYKNGIPIVFYIVTALACLCYFYVYFVCVLWFVFVRSTQTGELVGAMIVLSLGIAGKIGVVKFLNMFLYIDKIRKLTDDYLELDSQMIPGSRFSKNLLKLLRNVKKRAIFYWMVIMVNANLYIIKPFVTPGKHLPEDHFVLYGLEPMLKSPNFEIATILMSVSVSLICYISANVTAYLIVITGYAESQMLAMSKEVTHIWEDAEIHCGAIHEIENESNFFYKRNINMNKYVSERLKELMKHHATIRRLVSEVNDTFRRAIAVGILLLILGLIVELLGGLENTYLQIPFAFMQVGMDCFIGQRLLDAGEVLEQAVYNCKWENFDNNNMKMVLIMLQVSQNTMALTAGGVTKMDFRCLMSAMRLMYSSYTALRSTIKP